jgi:crotonobetainyl-CoA:carnitine CoA-transferase CaiB-like acyl-CoA transferase
MATGMWLALGVMGALIQRRVTGEGCRVTSSLYETAIAWMSYHFGGYWASGVSPSKWGSGAAMIAPYEAFPTADKWIIIAAGNDHLFERLCVVLGQKDWMEKDEFKTNEARVKNREQLNAMISEITKKRDSKYWVDLFESQGIPVAPVLNVEEVTREPQFEACGIVQHAMHPNIKKFRSIGLPLSINDERPPLRMIPPI